MATRNSTSPSGLYHEKNGDGTLGSLLKARKAIEGSSSSSHKRWRPPRANMKRRDDQQRECERPGEKEHERFLDPPPANDEHYRDEREDSGDCDVQEAIAADSPGGIDDVDHHPRQLSKDVGEGTAALHHLVLLRELREGFSDFTRFTAYEKLPSISPPTPSAPIRGRSARGLTTAAQTATKGMARSAVPLVAKASASASAPRASAGRARESKEHTADHDERADGNIV